MLLFFVAFYLNINAETIEETRNKDNIYVTDDVVLFSDCINITDQKLCLEEGVIFFFDDATAISKKRETKSKKIIKLLAKSKKPYKKGIETKKTSNRISFPKNQFFFLKNSFYNTFLLTSIFSFKDVRSAMINYVYKYGKSNFRNKYTINNRGFIAYNLKLFFFGYWQSTSDFYVLLKI